MIRDISFGQYYPADSPLHRMDPRAKITSLFLLYIGVFFWIVGSLTGSHLPFVLDLWPILGFRPKFIGAVPV